LYYATIKIETPETSVSGVFNCGVVFPVVGAKQAAEKLPKVGTVSAQRFVLDKKYAWSEV
jgi:hypothetical protein